MKIRIFALDDDDNALAFFNSQVKRYNLKNQDDIEVEFMSSTSPKDYIESFDGDLALIDINLRLPNMDGFDVARAISMKNPRATIFMCSSDVPDDEDHESFIQKKAFRMSELITRHLHLAKDRFMNRIEILNARDHYRHVRSA